MDKWKEVNMPADADSRSYYYSFRGRAVVVDDTIYAKCSAACRDYSILSYDGRNG
jgi:hypothetical protein